MNNSILLIEDDAEIQSTIRQWMQRAGYRVVAASTVTEGIVKLDNQRFDCILLDMNLGKASGEDIVRYLESRKDGNNSLTPIVVISGSINRGIVTQLRTKVASMLVKPFSSNTLLERVTSVIPPNRRPQVPI